MRVNGGKPRTGRRALLAALVLVGGACAVTPHPAAAATPTCAATLPATTTQSTTAAGGACWTDITPYPFGIDGLPVDPSGRLCTQTPAGGDPLSCYLTVTSMAFRAWNRGLAAASPSFASRPNAFGVWLFNGTRWFPDPTFPGSGACKGTTIVWAGKLDYWLIGGPANWPSLCRFDGVNFLWEPLAVPQATLDRITPPREPHAPSSKPNPPEPGSITSAACYSWDNCWFVGSYGSMLHWDGSTLSDASPDSSQGWLQTAFTGAIARVDQSGNPFGVAVGTTSAGPDSADAPQKVRLPTAPDGSPPPELYGSGGGPFGPLPFAPPSAALANDPYRTDLVAVDLGSDRQGWIAGDPAGLTAALQPLAGRVLRPTGRPGPAAGSAEPAPLLTTTSSGSPSGCSGTPANRFTYSVLPSSNAPTDAFLWSSISVFPGQGDALAGGQTWPATSGPGPQEDGSAEPVIVRAACDGTTTTTRFRVPDPLHTGPSPAPAAPADRAGFITAIAANASNDAWAAASTGALDRHTTDFQVFFQRPHLYRLSDGQPPAAPAGDDQEPRPLNLQFDPPPIPGPPPPPPPPPPPAPVKPRPVRDPRPTIYDLRSTLQTHGGLRLLLTFSLRRPVTLGAQALRGGRVVSATGLYRFRGPRGQLVLKIDVRHYPTGVRLVTDAPAVVLRDPGRRLSGTVALVATATPYPGRRIASVSFEYSPSGKGLWTTIATVTARPWTAPLATATLAPGRYDLRAVATDNKAVSGASAVLAKRSVAASGRG